MWLFDLIYQLYSIGKTAEGKVAYFHWGNHITVRSNRFTKLLDIIQHNNGTFVEPEIFNGMADLSILNVKGTISGQAG